MRPILHKIRQQTLFCNQQFRHVPALRFAIYYLLSEPYFKVVVRRRSENVNAKLRVYGAGNFRIWTQRV